ncbi:DUF6438 domain-containing protein [Portibacter lacus]|uniref:DUF6438 domain-containing protein n=1 Tax=Portibacter lacus TaxID=1099794 RepID=A0AA37SNV5_9BACT|nr:DUF6438 domain-containing protein [Portibacter lacus]GLR18233.1 hypothetical protein GCM10007940_28480 [Portibacter lacus]
MNTNSILVLLIGFIILLISCQEDQDLNLKGIWKFEKYIDKSAPKSAIYRPINKNYNFVSDKQFRFIPGILKELNSKPKSYEIIDPLIDFSISKNVLSYKSQFDSKEIQKKIVKLNSDTLILMDKENIVEVYLKVDDKSITNDEIDNITLSTSGCYGKCPVTNISISRKGKLVYICEKYCPNPGIKILQIDSLFANKVFAILKYIDINRLENRYEVDHTDDEIITTTFSKNNKIIKSIYDYGNKAPNELRWIYSFLRNFPGLNDQKLINPNFFPIDFPNYLMFMDSVSVMALTKAETFELYKNLIFGKEVENSPKLNYKISNNRLYYEGKFEYYQEYVNTNFGSTDGRYYRFNTSNGVKIIDLGYNFIELNSKFKTK